MQKIYIPTGDLPPYPDSAATSLVPLPHSTGYSPEQDMGSQVFCFLFCSCIRQVPHARHCSGTGDKGILKTSSGLSPAAQAVPVPPQVSTDRWNRELRREMAKPHL